MPVLSQTNSEA